MAQSKAVAADLLKLGFGEAGAAVISSIIAISALTSINATLIVGARSNFALGRDSASLGWLGDWNQSKGTPTHGLIAQCIASLALVLLGSITRQGLQSMIDYTAPVFWAFFLLVGIAIFVLRAREPERPRPFRIPLFPLPPLFFCATCAYLLYSSVEYARTGAIASIGIVVLGIALIARNHSRRALALLFVVLGAAIIALAFAGVRRRVFGN
jgi:amino acid transporter